MEVNARDKTIANWPEWAVYTSIGYHAEDQDPQ